MRRCASVAFSPKLLMPGRQNMIRSLFVNREAGQGRQSAPSGPAEAHVKKVAVHRRAGMMGAGIAYVQAMAGIETIS